MSHSTVLDDCVPYLQAIVEQLMQEWRVSDFAVAESIYKSRQRQLKQKGGAQLRQRMQVCNLSAHGSFYSF